MIKKSGERDTTKDTEAVVSSASIWMSSRSGTRILRYVVGMSKLLVKQYGFRVDDARLGEKLCLSG